MATKKAAGKKKAQRSKTASVRDLRATKAVTGGVRRKGTTT